jgi:hypothetical protein
VASVDVNGNNPYDPNQYPPPGSGPSGSNIPSPGSTPPPSTGGANATDISNWYNLFLGRSANPNEISGWQSGAYGATDPTGIQNQIRGSGEAQAYAARNAAGQGQTTTGVGPNGPYTITTNPTAQPGATTGGSDLMSRITQALSAAHSTDDPNYWYGKISADPNGGGSAWNYWLDRINRGDGSQMGLPRFNDAGGGSTQQAPPPYGGTNVFSDPATAQFEQLLNSMINKFQTPYTPPGYQQGIDQLQQYLQQLNGPAYTPGQMDLLQTQALDPLQQQHDAARQQVIQRFGAQGIGPSSGITQSALEQVDRGFEQQRTQLQGQFASNAVGLARQNAATAASLAPQISALQSQQYYSQDPRNLQAVNLASTIPALAMQRLGAAGGSIAPINTSSLLQLLGGFQNQGYNQSANYGSGIAQLLAALFGLAA